jgi:hypothetical protein
LKLAVWFFWRRAMVTLLSLYDYSTVVTDFVYRTLVFSVIEWMPT